MTTITDQLRAEKCLPHISPHLHRHAELSGGVVVAGILPPESHFLATLTTNFRYRRLGDLNLEPATLCACAGGEQQTIIKIVIHFL